MNSSLQFPEPLVAILMGTKNGERFLAEQINSLEIQTHKNWVLYVSDDGSTDKTIAILREYQVKWPNGKMIISNGPEQGFCMNFLSMACDPSIRAEYYAFCDQDDVWHPNKISSAISNLSQVQLDKRKKNTPLLYCGRTTYIDENNNPIGSSPHFIFPLTFRNALIQCVAGGNTMIFNQEVKSLLNDIGAMPHTSHDWFLYQLVTSTGGTVYFDQAVFVYYRQHKNSLSGGNQSFPAKVDRILMVINGKFKEMNNLNLTALNKIKNIMTNSSIEVLDLFQKLRISNFKDRLRLFEVAGLYRQTWRGTFSLIIAALFKKI